MASDGLTQDDVVARAARLGDSLHRTTLSRILNGRVVPTLPTLRAIASALGMPDLLESFLAPVSGTRIDDEARVHVARFRVDGRQLSSVKGEPRFIFSADDDPQAAARMLAAVVVYIDNDEPGVMHGDLVVIDVAHRSPTDDQLVALVDPIEDDVLRMGRARRLTPTSYEVTTGSGEIMAVHREELLGTVYGVWRHGVAAPVVPQPAHASLLTDVARLAAVASL